MWRERRTQAFATLEIVGEGLELRAIKLLNPVILANNQRSFRLSKFSGERRFPCGYLAAQHVQRGVRTRHWLGSLAEAGVPARMNGDRD